MITPSNRQHSRPRTVCIEREALRLERTADMFTARLEYERKQGMLLTEQIRMLEEELKSRKIATKRAVSANNPEELRMRVKIAALEHQIHLIAASTAETQTDSSCLKEKIESCRREKQNYKHAIGTLAEDLEYVKTRRAAADNDRLRYMREDEEHRKRLEQIRSKSAQQQYRRRTHIAELEVKCTQTVIREDLAVRDNFFRGLEENFKTSMLRALETLDPSPVQQALLQKWHHVPLTQKVSTAKRDFDSYLRHIKLLGEAFQHIQETSGIESLQDIVTEIVKTTEQHTSLYSHMNKLMAEIDALEEVLTVAKRSIARQRETRESGQQTANSQKSELQARLSALKSSVDSKRLSLSSVNDSLTAVFASVLAAVELFATPAFQEIAVMKARVDESINSRTIMSYLAEVDAGITSLVTWLAFINEGGKHHPALGEMAKKTSDHLTPTIRGLTAVLNTETEGDERGPLKESEIRSRAKLWLDQRSLHSNSTLTTTVSRHETKRHAVTPH